MVLAAVATWVSTAVVGVVTLIGIAVLVSSPDQFVDDAVRQQPEVASVARSTLVGTAIAMGLVVLLWCLVAAVLAVLVVRGREWARVTLVVSASVAGLVSLVVGASAIGSGGGLLVLLPLAACFVVSAALLRPDARAWSRGGMRP